MMYGRLYLNNGFFKELARRFKRNIVLILAQKDGKVIFELRLQSTFPVPFQYTQYHVWYCGIVVCVFDAITRLHEYY